MNQTNIRNFAIIAHIDHGKSTLADRLLETTGTVKMRDMREQILDSNPIERERGITIKLAPVRMIYKIRNSNIETRNKNKIQNSNVQNDLGFRASNFGFSSSEYILNLIDTPGHVDFNYEVSRSLQACEGALLVVDATQGVQAQTLANLILARKLNLVIIPIINKIDLPNAQIEETSKQLEELGFAKNDIILISAKTGLNIEHILQAIIERIPPPHGEPVEPLRALIFSSQYDTHKGVVCYVRVVDGEINAKQKLHFLISGAVIEPIEIGYFIPKMRLTDHLFNGEVGYIATGLKDVSLAKVGDTITIQSQSKLVKPASPAGRLVKLDQLGDASVSVKSISDNRVTPLPGYKEPKPMVFLGLFPINSDEYPQVREALGKLRLSDSAFNFRPISSLALGNGFHCGFLGLLHAEVVQERLSREFNLSLLATAPSVEYKIKLKNPKSQIPNSNQIQNSNNQSLNANLLDAKRLTLISITSASEYPDPSLISQAYEPMMEVTIFSPKKYVGAIMQLAQDKRGEYIDLTYVSDQAKFTYLLPLSEMIIDFFDKLKSMTEGYASMNYEFFDYQPVELVKLDILLNHEKVDAFSQLVVESKAAQIGKIMAEKLKEVIPRHQFAVPIQAAVGGEVVAREDVKPFRKDVLQKLYGGDRTRKDKLLEAQKKGKKKMKRVGNVEIRQSAFIEVFKR